MLLTENQILTLKSNYKNLYLTKYFPNKIALMGIRHKEKKIAINKTKIAILEYNLWDKNDPEEEDKIFIELLEKIVDAFNAIKD